MRAKRPSRVVENVNIDDRENMSLNNEDLSKTTHSVFDLQYLI